MTPTLDSTQTDIRTFANSQHASTSLWFFKTGPGEYGAGDKFLGLSTPQMRSLSKKYQDLPLPVVRQLIKSPFHEDRSIAIQILVYRYPTSPQLVYDFYLNHTRYINNWDLVDISAPKIVGVHLLGKNWDILKSLARSESLWERRIAIISTLTFINQNDPKPTLTISKLLLTDKEDLIHKAVGWMLREVGKKCSLEVEQQFLKTNYPYLPRTTLRYAIECFPEVLRLQYLKGSLS